MRAHQDGAAVLPQFQEHLLELLDRVGVQADQRFVQHDHLRRGQKRAADAHLLLHALAQLAAQLVLLIVQLHALQQRIRLFLPIFHLIGPRDKLQMLPHGQRLKQRRHLRDIAELLFGLHALVWMAADRDISLETQKARDAFDRRGFSRAVRPQQNGDFARIYREIQMVVRHQAIINLCQVRHL